MSEPISVPRVGMLATVRQRRGIVTAVEPYGARGERASHLVRIEYTDTNGPTEDTLLWEHEARARLLEPTALPRVADRPCLQPAELDALVRTVRWGALVPLVSPQNPGEAAETPIAAPLFGAVEVDDFQLVPLSRALAMPRVSLLLADDVGLGKTVEAGLVLNELLLQRRIRRVLVLTPAALRTQWRDEMHSKLALPFELVDREETFALQKRLGLDASPWRTYGRVIASYYYLRQPDVLEQFLATCRPSEDRAGAAPAAHLPWDLLIVDEAHNLMPQPLGDDSDLVEMLRQITPYFEHKLFLTATPHNGHTESFTGLLELLDPVRFVQTDELTEAQRTRVEQVVVRRLKREINELDDAQTRPRRFAERKLVEKPLHFRKAERALAEAFAQLRTAVRTKTRTAKEAERHAAGFALQILGKRLLSSPSTFAVSWHRFRAGMAEAEAASLADVDAARKNAEEDLDDDAEREGRIDHATRTIGAWIQPFAESLRAELSAVDAALVALGLGPTESGPLGDPREDARFERLQQLIDEELRRGKAWRSDERLILFTEYKTTLDHLERRLCAAYGEVPRKGALRVLYGGMDQKERDAIKAAFNDPEDSVRVLLATDAAAEGLNLQETARHLLHFDVPWNPSRLEQRNGRLDRHGQARDVTVFHFTSENDADLEFLARVVEKVSQIREDLGSMGEVFDRAFERRFERDEDAREVQRKLEHDVAIKKGQSAIPRAVDTGTGREAARIRALARDIDLSPETLRDALETAMGLESAPPRLLGPDDRGRHTIAMPPPETWKPILDDSLRLRGERHKKGAMPSIIFDPRLFQQKIGERSVFRPSPDTVLLHLGHPVFRHALAELSRRRFPGGERARSFADRAWTVRRGPVPEGCDALVLLTVEEMAVNELREPVHHFVRTLRLPIRDGSLREALPYVAPADERATVVSPSDQLVAEARGLWNEIEHDVREALVAHTKVLTKSVQKVLASEAKRVEREERRRFDDRSKEIEAAKASNTVDRMNKQIAKWRKQQAQQLLFDDPEAEMRSRKIRSAEEEVARRTHRYDELLTVVKRERERVLSVLLPSRFALRGDVRGFPVAVEIRFPEARS